MHHGLDIAASGTVPVVAAAEGVITRSYYSTSYGNVVFISHNINGQTYTTVYAHLKEPFCFCWSKSEARTTTWHNGEYRTI